MDACTLDNVAHKDKIRCQPLHRSVRRRAKHKDCLQADCQATGCSDSVTQDTVLHGGLPSACSCILLQQPRQTSRPAPGRPWLLPLLPEQITAVTLLMCCCLYKIWCTYCEVRCYSIIAATAAQKRIEMHRPKRDRWCESRNHTLAASRACCTPAVSSLASLVCAADSCLSQFKSDMQCSNAPVQTSARCST